MAKRAAVDHGLRYGEGTVTEKPNGTYLARWYEPTPDGSRKRASRLFSTLDAAQDHLRSIARQMRDGQYVPNGDVTVRDLVAQWLMRGVGRWKPATLATYRQRADSHVLPHLGELKAERLTTPRVQQWIDLLQRAELEPVTIDGAHRVLSGALREAAQIGLISRNAAVGVRKPPVRQKPIAIWTGDEVRRVLATVAPQPMWHAAYRVALATGMRPGELAVLRWSDVDLEAGTVIVRRTMSKSVDGKQVIGESTKSGRRRDIALASSAVAALKEWRRLQLERRLAAPDWQDLNLVFTTAAGRLVSQRHWQDKLEELIAKADVTRITPHGMRHTAATLMLDRGVPLKIVSEILGHASTAITADLYQHVSTAMQRTAVAELDAVMNG